ncbi:hypothetical protein BDK51DRAFT_20030, partial [Blyttiomyces helicus]
MTSATQGRAGLGIEGLSLDTVPNCNVSKDLLQISSGLHMQLVDEADFYTVQVHFNRGWKLLLLGLGQAESFARYMAMVALRRAIPTINDTLMDNQTRENLIRMLINLMISDERSENRLKAVYLLGQLAFYLGTVREHDDLLFIAYNELSKKLLEIQSEEKRNQDNPRRFTQANRSLKIYLFHAIGKFTSHAHKQSRVIEDLVLYMIHEELAQGDSKVIQSPQAKLDTARKSMATHVVRAALGILNNESFFFLTKLNRKYVGAIFKQYVHPMMRSTNQALQTMAVQFVSNWLPICDEDATLLGIEAISKGLQYAKVLNVNVDKEAHEAEAKSLNQKIRAEETRMAMRSKLLRQLLLVPGTFAKLVPVANHPGFFAECNSSMMHTKGIVVNLPIHPKSSVLLTRPLPSIPGVPPAVTTIPPLFMDQHWAEKQQPPTTRYDFLERTGQIPGLPFGFTYAPGALVDRHRRLSVAAKRAEKLALASLGDFRAKLEVGGATILKKEKLKKERCEIPAGTARNPPKSDISIHDNRRPPLGFLSTCPFPHYDPDRIDRAAHPLSAIYGKQMGPGRRHSSMKSSRKAEQSSKTGGEYDAPDGFTVDRHPVLWPSRIGTLRTASNPSDFPVNAPVIFDIIQPGSTILQRVQARVNGINKEVSAISVQQESNDRYVVRSERGKEYGEAESRLTYSRRKSTLMNSNLPTFDAQQSGAPTSSILPIPSGFSGQGEPYFAPPINFPPFPAGYTGTGSAYFGKSSPVRPQPLGLTTQGVRFYAVDPKLKLDQPGRRQIAGYDNVGHPFFIPRGCTLPAPTGFTTDGIAYYDVTSLLHQRGVMVLPTPLADRPTWPTFDDEEVVFSSHSGLHTRPSGPVKYDPNIITSQLVESLELSQPGLKENFLQTRERAVGPLHRVADFNKLRRDTAQNISEVEVIEEPVDIVGFLRDSEDSVTTTPAAIRVMLDPTSLEFQSVHATVPKGIALRYRAGRGDHEERDFFVSVEPVDVFVVKPFHIRLQGEGVHELVVTFVPTAMKIDRVEGSLNLIDDSGRKIASCSLVATRKSFIKVTPTSLDAGWLLPEKKKECHITIESISSVVSNVSLKLQSEPHDPIKPPATAHASSGNHESNYPTKRNPFTLATKTIRLQALEQKTVTLFFEPNTLGSFVDVVEIHGPGGDLIRIPIIGIAGIPIALYPESEENSLAGGAALTRERCEFMRKFRRVDTTSHSRIPLTDEDTAILKNMMSATSDHDSRKEAHTLDFGICQSEPHERMRCLTLMNLGDTALTVGLFPHNSALRCPYLVRIAPHMACTVEVRLSITDSPQAQRGNFRTAIEVICPEFQNIPVNVLGFIGQPVFIPSWDFAFFKPCRINYQENLSMTLVNESHYTLDIVIDNIGSEGLSDAAQNFFKSSMSCSDRACTTLPPFSNIPVSFTFCARVRGALLQTIELRIIKPFPTTLPAAQFKRPLSLVGLCIEPYVHKPGEIPDKNGIDFLRMWMSHPKRLIDEYPSPEERAQRFDTKPRTADTRPHRPANDENSLPDISFARDPVIFRQSTGTTPQGQMADIRRSQMQPVLVQNRSTRPLNALFFGSTGFSVDPRAKLMQPGDAENVDIMFIPQADASNQVVTYGFAIALIDTDHLFNAIQVLGKRATDFLIFPSPSKDGVLTIDFGKVELSTQSLEINTKHIILCNTYATSYTWTVKFVSVKGKFSAFEVGMIMGELQPNDSFAIPFRYHSDTSGAFESMAEIYIKETMDRVAKPIKILSVILRGQTVNTSLGGLPESMEFGSTVVFQRKKKSFVITNVGSTEAPVTVLTRPPFSVIPKTFILGPKGQQEIEVTYTPTESRISQVKMLVFSNQKLWIVMLSGTGGTAELICEKYTKRSMDFGFQREGTVGWLSLYLTNKGTLPLCLKAITADLPEIVKVEFLTVTSTVPYEGDQSMKAKGQTVMVRRDFWSVLRRKFQVFTVLSQLIGKGAGVKKSGGSHSKPDEPFEEEGILIRIPKTGTIDLISQNMMPIIPMLRPFYSYHLRVGYTNRYQARNGTDVSFHYMPITTDESPDTMAELVKSMSLHVVGHVYRPLELYPPFHDFGVAPAQCFMESDSRHRHETESLLGNTYGVQREGQNNGEAILELQVLNMSFEAQYLTLQSINPEFTVMGRTWQLQAGEKLSIPIEFHPPKEQVQYHGEAHFIHKYGASVIRLGGTGASAALVADESVNFGSLKVGTLGTAILRLHNRGLLQCRYTLEIIQSGIDFCLVGEEPLEHEGVIESGGSENIEFDCCCESNTQSDAHVLIKWLRVPRGIWEELVIPLIVQIGMPIFRLQQLEIDFGTTYINVNKTIEFGVTNDGNASCSWTVEFDNVNIIIDPESGSLLPGEAVYLQLTFAPVEFEALRSVVYFNTDAGVKTLTCYGIVGVPYLSIPEEGLYHDYGIVGVSKTHIRRVAFTNTGSKPIEYEISFVEKKQDGIEMAPEDFDVFYINPAQGIIEPGGVTHIQFQCIPREYNAIYTADWIVRTRDGEEYCGRLSATGGKAIIKIAPPKISEVDGGVAKQAAAEMSVSTPHSRGKTPKDAEVSSTESVKQALMLHLANLQEVLAGLRTAELD